MIIIIIIEKKQKTRVQNFSLERQRQSEKSNYRDFLLLVEI